MFFNTNFVCKKSVTQPLEFAIRQYRKKVEMKKKIEIAAIVLAGGKDTRFSHMIGSKQKVLYEIAGRPLIKHTTDLLSPDFI